VRINYRISAPKVRLIDEDGSQIGIVDSSEALRRAKEKELDLVEIAPDAKPPVCRIMNYGKFLFEQGKKSKKKAKQVTTKEIKMRPNTDIGDYTIKLKKIINFLENGDKVKITVRFRGREIAYKQLGNDILHRMENDLVESGVVEQQARLEGKQMSIVVAPKRK
jgi:translation initiation factor IF-3